jgi:hypothetical protein
LSKLLGDRFDLRWTLSRPEVGEARLGCLQLLLGLPARGDLVLTLEREYRRTRRDRIAESCCSVPANGAAILTYSPSM